MRKGEATREKILDVAFRLAARDGLEGLSLADLAASLGVSKSGLFAHFSSKEELQVETLKTAAARFEDAVLRPAFKRQRGLPRLRHLFELWLRWATDPSLPGGCLILSAATELDDREGKPREFLVAAERLLLASLARSASLAVEAGHLRRELDCEQLAFELVGIMLVYNQSRRLLRDPKAEKRARAAFERLLASAALRS